MFVLWEYFCVRFVFFLLIFIGRFFAQGMDMDSMDRDHSLFQNLPLVYQGFENKGRPNSNVPNNNYSIDWFRHKTYKAMSAVSKIAHIDE